MPLTFSGFSIWLKHKCRDRHKKHQNSPPNRSNASQTTIPTKSILQLRPRFLNIHLVPGDRPRSPLVHIIISSPPIRVFVGVNLMQNNNNTSKILHTHQTFANRVQFSRVHTMYFIRRNTVHSTRLSGTMYTQAIR